jgi:hypothetical protein
MVSRRPHVGQYHSSAPEGWAVSKTISCRDCSFICLLLEQKTTQTKSSLFQAHRFLIPEINPGAQHIPVINLTEKNRDRYTVSPFIQVYNSIRHLKKTRFCAVLQNNIAHRLYDD